MTENSLHGVISEIAAELLMDGAADYCALIDDNPKKAAALFRRAAAVKGESTRDQG